MNIWCWFFMINSTNQFDFSKDNQFYQFFLDSFNLWSPLLMITLYYQTKISIDPWCRRELNLKSLIQSSKTLRVKLIRTHKFYQLSKLTKCKFGTSWKFQLIYNFNLFCYYSWVSLYYIANFYIYLQYFQ